jgi:hypothetical protein
MASTAHPSFKELAGPRVTTLIEFILEKYEVVEPGTGTVPTLDTILQDEGLQRMIINMGQELQKEDEEKAKKKVIKKKSSEKKATAKKSSPKKALAELNSEDFDGDRCFARKWEAESGLGYDNIQCSTCKKIPKEDAEKVLKEFKDKMNEPQLENMDVYIEKYDGCFCKNHLKQDFFMPNGWWLGKVNEDRPEKPMLPKGSLKDGYRDDYKEHFWMYDSEGKKVEKSSKKKIVKKKKKTEEPEAKVEKPKKIVKKKKKTEEPKPEVEVVEEPKKIVKKKKKTEEPKPEIEAVEEPKPEVEVVEEPKPEIEAVEEQTPEVEDDDKTEPLSSDDESYEAEEYIVDGTEYMKVWDEDEKMWVIVDPESQDMVGFPDGNGGITPV